MVSLRNVEQEARESIDSLGEVPNHLALSPALVLGSTVTSWGAARLNQQPVRLAAIHTGLLVPVVLVSRYLVRLDGQVPMIHGARPVKTTVGDVRLEEAH